MKKRKIYIHASSEVILRQAEGIQTAIQRIIECCKNGKELDAYTHSVLLGGSLSQDITTLALQVLAYEADINTDEENI